MSLLNKKHLALSMIVVSQILVGCGGGGGGDSPAPVAATPGTPAASPPAAATPGSPPAATPIAVAPIPTTLNLDLKSVDGSKSAASLAISAINTAQVFNGTGPKNSPFYLPNYSNQITCPGGGTNVLTVTNPDAIPSEGDSFGYVATNCVTKDDDGIGSSTDTGNFSYSLASIAGNAADLNSTFAMGVTLASQSSAIFNHGINGTRYQGTGTSNASGSFTNTHDGKGTAADADDSDITLANITGTSSGTANGATFSVTLQSTTECTSTGVGTPTATAVCNKLDTKFFGTAPGVGGLNLTIAIATPVSLNKDLEPIAGGLTVTQGTDKITITFSLNSAKQPVATITSANGSVSTVLYTDLVKLGDSIFF